MLFRSDASQAEHPPAEPADDTELLGFLEAAIDELPGPLLERVASLPLRVQARATKEQVAEGVDPRSTVALVFGTGERSRAVEAVVVMRDVVRDEAVMDADLGELLLEDIGEAITAALGAEVVLARG